MSNIDPNKYLERSIRELFGAVVQPICGQTRDFLFTCRLEEFLNSVQRMHEILYYNHLLDADEFYLEYMPHENPKNRGSGAFVLTIPEGKYTPEQLQQKSNLAYQLTDRLCEAARNPPAPIIIPEPIAA